MIDNKQLVKLIKRLVFSDVVANQADFASKLAYDRSTISGMTSGKKPITESFANKVSEIFDVNINWLRTGEGEMLKTDTLKTEPMQSSEMIAMPREVLDLLLSQQKTIDYQVQAINSQQSNFTKLTDAVVAQQQTIAELVKKGDAVGNAGVAAG